MEARRGYTGKTESCHVSLQFDIAFSWKIATPRLLSARNDGAFKDVAQLFVIARREQSEQRGNLVLATIYPVNKGSVTLRKIWN